MIYMSKIGKLNFRILNGGISPPFFIIFLTEEGFFFRMGNTRLLISVSWKGES